MEMPPRQIPPIAGMVGEGIEVALQELHARLGNLETRNANIQLVHQQNNVYFQSPPRDTNMLSSALESNNNRSPKGWRPSGHIGPFSSYESRDGFLLNLQAYSAENTDVPNESPSSLRQYNICSRILDECFTSIQRDEITSPNFTRERPGTLNLFNLEQAINASSLQLTEVEERAKAKSKYKKFVRRQNETLMGSFIRLKNIALTAGKQLLSEEEETVSQLFSEFVAKLRINELMTTTILMQNANREPNVGKLGEIIQSIDRAQRNAKCIEQPEVKPVFNSKGKGKGKWYSQKPNQYSNWFGKQKGKNSFSQGSTAKGNDSSSSSAVFSPKNNSNNNSPQYSPNNYSNKNGSGKSWNNSSSSSSSAFPQKSGSWNPKGWKKGSFFSPSSKSRKGKGKKGGKRGTWVKRPESGKSSSEKVFWTEEEEEEIGWENEGSDWYTESFEDEQVFWNEEEEETNDWYDANDWSGNVHEEECWEEHPVETTNQDEETEKTEEVGDQEEQDHQVLLAMLDSL